MYIHWLAGNECKSVLICVQGLHKQAGMRGCRVQHTPEGGQKVWILVLAVPLTYTWRWAYDLLAESQHHPLWGVFISNCLSTKQSRPMGQAGPSPSPSSLTNCVALSMFLTPLSLGFLIWTTGIRLRFNSKGTVEIKWSRACKVFNTDLAHGKYENNVSGSCHCYSLTGLCIFPFDTTPWSN